MEWIMKGIKFLFTIDSWEKSVALFEKNLEIVNLYFGDSLYLILYIVGIFYLLYKRADVRKRFLYPIILLIIFFLIPKTSSFMVSYMFEGRTVFWRFLWLLQVNLVIAFAIVEFISGIKKGRQVVLVGILLLLVGIGKFIFIPENFQCSENAYKIPKNVIEISEMIKSDAVERENPFVVAPSQISYWVRMYDANIHLLYGRYSIPNYTKSEKTQPIDMYLTFGVGDKEIIFDDIEASNCAYMVAIMNDDLIDEADERGYVLLGIVEKYSVYRVNLQ